MPENRLLTALREALRHVLEGLGLAAPPIHYVGGSDTLPPPLPRSEEAEAIAALDARYAPLPGATRAQSSCSSSTTSVSSSTLRAGLKTRA